MRPQTRKEPHDVPEFAERVSKEAVETGCALAPKFDADGLVPVVTTDYATGELLMVAYMNAEALKRTIEIGEAVYWSRSRKEIWHKGATSGHVQSVTDIRIDCDQDAVLLRVRTAGTGANCHTGRKGCFYRRVKTGTEGAEPALEFTGDQPLFDPKAVYKG